MTIRQRIADWITRGDYSRQRIYSATNNLSNVLYMENIERFQARLDRIAACETPGANATVRRMARIAKGEE